MNSGGIAILKIRHGGYIRRIASVEKSFKSASTAIDAKRPLLTLISTGRLRQQTGETNAETKSYSRDSAFTGADSISGFAFKTEKTVGPAMSSLSPALVTQTSSPAPLLITESRQEFKRLRRALRQEINPRGPIEKMYLADIAYLEWEIKRLRRGKIAMLNTAFRKGLEKLLTELMRAPHQESLGSRRQGERHRIRLVLQCQDEEARSGAARELRARHNCDRGQGSPGLQFTACRIRSFARVCGVPPAEGCSSPD